MTVLELLDELEEMINNASKLPLTGKVMVDAGEILEMAQDIRLSLPDDVQQAQWVKEEKEKILAEAKSEYEKIITEAKKQADIMVEKDVITQRAVEVSKDIRRRADKYSQDMTLRTYGYMDDVLSNFRGKMDEINNRYFAAMYDDVSKHMEAITGKIEGDLNEIRRMTEEAQNAALPEHNIEIPVNDVYSPEDGE